VSQSDGARWTALVLAGSRPGRDPMAEGAGVRLKALLPVAGRPMVVRPVEALLAARGIAAVKVLSQTPDLLAEALPADPRVTQAPSGSSIAETLDALCADRATPWPLLVTTADHALLTAAMVEDFLTQAAGADLAIGVVNEAALMARLPQTRRTWLRFRAEAVSGANLFALASPRVRSAIGLWRGVEQDRKRGWRVLAALGWPVLLGAVLRVRGVDATAAAIGRRLGLTLRVVRLSDPLAAVDVDKPDDHRLVEAILRGEK
jgi:GTP:adenosylcobinamide-phosphate guanylyltransferase